MPPQQRVFGLAVIEVLGQPGLGDALPAAGVVTGLAALLTEAATVGIGVTIGTFPKRQSLVARLIVRSGRVALLASDLGVQSSQWIARFRVIELSCHAFPIIEVMALQAVLP